MKNLRLHLFGLSEQLSMEKKLKSNQTTNLDPFFYQSSNLLVMLDKSGAQGTSRSRAY